MTSSTPSTRPDVRRKDEPNPEGPAGGESLPVPFQPPQLMCGCPLRAEKELWVRQKYVDKRFVRSSAQDPDPGLCLYQAALAGDLVAMAAALARGAEVNQSFSGEEGRTALIAAAVGVNEPFGPCWEAVWILIPDPDPLALLCRGHWWPVSSCCSTAPTSTIGTREVGERCTLPPLLATLGTAPPQD